jgi:hypothetical protein
MQRESRRMIWILGIAVIARASSTHLKKKNPKSENNILITVGLNPEPGRYSEKQKAKKN